jgi:hypothetical protein
VYRAIKREDNAVSDLAIVACVAIAGMVSTIVVFAGGGIG